MNRILAGTLLTFALGGTVSAANAATSTPPIPQRTAYSHTISTPVGFSSQCRTLGAQWNSVAPSHASNRHFSTAKADAARGERDCKSTNTAMIRKGAGQYETALKLIGVRPTI